MRLLPALLLVVSCLSAQACKSRSVWFWQDTNSPFGSANIVGTNALENQTVAFLQGKSVKRVYGSYGQKPVTDPPVIAAWNAKLQAAGIQSQFLMSENTWIFPSNHASFLSKISARVIDFNNAPGRTVPQKFDGIHLDIEPHALTGPGGWSSLTATDKRDYLFLLRDTYALVRQHLTNEGAPTFPVYADLPVWFDKLPVDGGQIGWTDAAERNQWFADLAVSLTGITLMAFDQTSFSAISNSVSWERANTFGLDVRVGLEADIGATNTWTTLPDFNAMMQTVEVAFGFGDAVDIQSYSLWRQAVATLPLVSVVAALRISRPLAGDLTFEVETNWTYLIQQSFDLCDWQEIQRINFQQAVLMKFPVLLTEPQGFWSITRFQTPEP